MNSDVPPELPIVPAPEPEPKAPEAARPWGFWATLGWGILIALGYLIAQTAGVVVFVFIDGRAPTIHRLDMEELTSNGKLVAIAVLLSTPVVVAMSVGAAYLRKELSLKDYFALRWPPWKTMAKWLGGFLVFMVVVDVSLMFLEGEVTQRFMEDVLDTAGWAMPLLWFALVVGAPLSEEFFFRGFLFAGLKNSWLGPFGTIAATSILFASIHLQYDIQGALFVFLAGIFFGIARWKTDSLWMPVILHSVMNFIATVMQMYFGE